MFEHQLDLALAPVEEARVLGAERRHAGVRACDPLVGALVRDVIPPPSREMVLNHYRDAIRLGRTVRWKEVSAYPSGQKTGEVAVTQRSALDDALPIVQAVYLAGLDPSYDLFDSIMNKYVSVPSDNLRAFSTQFQLNPNDLGVIDQSRMYMQSLYVEIVNTPTVGASGAIFGILLAFGMLFPNTELMLLFPPIPIKAKWFVLGYGAIELYSGLSQPGSNIAHFAHLGGMLFGFFLIKYWNSKRTNFY